MGYSLLVVSASVLCDKHPDPSKRKPRPVWGCIEGYEESGAIRVALEEMLGVWPEVRCILLDTDSRTGDPSTASCWVANPLASKRADASLHSVLTIAGIESDRVKRYHGHSCKRFCLNVAEASPLFDALEATEVGRFSGSTAQNTDLEPREAMLRAHTQRVSVLPAIYGGLAKVAKVFDAICKLHLVGCAAVRILRSSSSPGSFDHWGEDGAVAQVRELDREHLRRFSPLSDLTP